MRGCAKPNRGEGIVPLGCVFHAKAGKVLGEKNEKKGKSWHEGDIGSSFNPETRTSVTGGHKNQGKQRVSGTWFQGKKDTKKGGKIPDIFTMSNLIDENGGILVTHSGFRAQRLYHEPGRERKRRGG